MRWTLLLVVVLLGVVPPLEERYRHVLLPMLDQELMGIDTWRPPTVVKVLDHDGLAVDEFALVRRDWVDLDDLPPLVWQALVSAEDRRYFLHRGVDFQGIARAMVVNLQAGELRQGGSTLTQQLVKNIVVGSERSLERKIHEAALAWRLEQKLDKRRILELYLNFVYLGSGNYGVEAAAQDYFGKHARDLDAGEAAMLAGLVPAPTAYSPRRSPETARERRRIVLDAMVEMGFVDVLDAQIAKHAPVDPPRRGEDGGTGSAYFTQVRREVRRLLGDRVPFEQGLRVFTPYDRHVQETAEAAIRDAAMAVEKRQGNHGARRTLAAEEIDVFLNPDDPVAAPRAVGDCLDVVFLGERTVGAGASRWRFDDAAWSRRIWNPDPEAPARTLQQVARRGDVYSVCVGPRATVGLQETPWVEGAAAVVENATGRVVALVGGRDMPIEGFNRATQALRQAGSSFKPYVYATAIEQRHTEIDTVYDGPISLAAGGGHTWSPENYDGSYHGNLPLRTAFALSLNTVAVRLALETGVPSIAATAHAAGIHSVLREDLTLALGSSEVAVLDQAMGISTFLRMGRSATPIYLDRLVDVRGIEVGQAGQPVRIADTDVLLPGGLGAAAVSPATAWQMLDLMRGVVEEGTARSAYVKGEIRGGKTGTTSGFVDAWFVGWVPAYTVVVWIGQDDRRALGMGETGGKAALPAWKSIVASLPKREDVTLTPPPDTVLLPWNDKWVGLQADRVPQALLAWKTPGEEPLSDFPSTRPAPCPAGEVRP